MRPTVRFAVDVSGRSGDQVSGALMNEPANLPGRREGDHATVEVSDIGDWSNERDGLMYGNFTTRVRLERMSLEDAAELRPELSPNPLETDGR